MDLPFIPDPALSDSNYDEARLAKWYEAQPENSPEMYFGKYKGKTLRQIAEIDKRYLEWMVKEDWVKKRLRENIVHVLETHVTIGTHPR